MIEKIIVFSLTLFFLLSSFQVNSKENNLEIDNAINHSWTDEKTFNIKAKNNEIVIPKSKIFLDWPMTYGLLFGKIQDPYIEINNDVEYLNFYASNVYFFYLTYGFGGLNYFFFDKISEKNCRMSIGFLRSFFGYFDADSIFGRYDGYFP